MNPSEITVADGYLIELRLLTDPKDPERQKAHQVHQNARQQCDDRQPQIALGVNGIDARNAQVQNQNCHSHGENAVAQRLEPGKIPAGNLIVVGWHAGKSIGSRNEISSKGDGAFDGVIQLEGASNQEVAEAEARCA